MSIADLKARVGQLREIKTHNASSEEHDQICRYVKQPEILSKIAASIFPGEEICIGHCRTEVPMVQLGARGFKRDVGYADIVCELNGHVCCLEVKSGKIVVGEVLRQLKLYAQNYPVVGELCLLLGDGWSGVLGQPTVLVLVAAHLEPEQVEHLRSEGVTPIVLGTKYLEWKAPKGAPAFEI